MGRGDTPRILRSCFTSESEVNNSNVYKSVSCTGKIKADVIIQDNRRFSLSKWKRKQAEIVKCGIFNDTELSTRASTL